MKEIECEIKNYEKIMLRLFKVNGMPFDYYEVVASNMDGSLVGRLGFELAYNHSKSNLCNIRVASDYLNKGVGRSMNHFFEQFLLQNDCHEISGVYHPMGEGAKFAYHFYTHNGYRITDKDDEYNMLGKHIDRDYNVPQFIESEATDKFAKLKDSEQQRD